MSTRTPHYLNLDFSPFATGAHVGGDSALVTSDGDTSYVEVGWDDDTEIVTGHTFRWQPAGPVPADAVVTIEADYLIGPSGGAFIIAFNHPTLGYRIVATFGALSGPTHPYGDPQTDDISSSWVEDGTPFMPGIDWVVFSAQGAFGQTFLTRITRLTMHITGGSTPHLRQRNRGTLRASRLADRGRSIRQRGFL